MGGVRREVLERQEGPGQQASSDTTWLQLLLLDLNLLLNTRNNFKNFNLLPKDYFNKLTINCLYVIPYPGHSDHLIEV